MSAGRGKWGRRLAVVLLVVGAGTALRFTLLRPRAVPVTVHRATTGRVEESVTNSRSGSVKSRHRATLSPETGGRVDRILVREGERVRKGEPLLVLSSGDADARLDVARRTLEAARAASDEACTGASLARRELERSEGLFREGIASDQQVDQLRSRRDAAESTCQAARARIGEAEATLALARVGRRQIELVAPFDGLVADVSTEVGEWITPSPPGLPIPAVIEMFDPSSLFVAAPLDEVEVGKVAVGLPVRITMDACPGKAFSGKLTRIAPIVLDRVEQNRTFEIEVEFDDAAFARTLLPGTSADVEVIREARDGVLRIPSYALVAGKRVLVAREGRLVSTEVATGLRNWAFVEVRSGLAAGDLVVVSLDRAEVRDGARVAATEEIAK